MHPGKIIFMDTKQGLTRGHRIEGSQRLMVKWKMRSPDACYILVQIWNSNSFNHKFHITKSIERLLGNGTTVFEKGWTKSD